MKVKGIAKLLSAVMAMTCISFPAVSHAEDTTTATEAVRVDFAVPSNLYDNSAIVKLQALYLGTDTGGGGAEYGMNLTGTRGLTDGRRYYEMNIDDNTLTEAQMRTDKKIKGESVKQNPLKPTAPKAPDPTDTEKYPNGEEDANYITNKAAYDELMVEYNEKLEVYNKSTKMIEPNTGWGFHGMKVNQYDAESGKYFGAVQNLNGYEDVAAAVYKIKIDEEGTSEGAINDAYLTIGYYSNINDTNKGSNHGYSRDFKEFDETYTDDANAGMWHLRVAGVKFTDYYNDANPVDEFGYHTVVVPISAFKTGNAEFKKHFDAILPPYDDDDTTELNLGMVKIVGVARQDSHSEKTFKFESRGYALVAPLAPTEVEAVKTDSGVSITWKNTTDTDVEYEVVKEIDGVKTVLGKSATEAFTEENFDPSAVEDEIRYYVVAKDTTYGVENASEPAILNETVKTSSLAKQFITSKTGWWDGTQFPTTGGAYYVGSANDSGDYTAYSGAEFKTENGERIFRAHMNDSDASSNAINANAGWGFRGMITNWNANDGEKYGIDLPSYGNVVNVKADEDNAYAVFAVKVEAGSADGAYLTLAYFSNADDTSYQRTYGSDSKAVTEFDSKASGDAMITRLRMAGLPLADYYNNSPVTDNGYHLIAIPLKEFKENDVFKKVFVKTTDTTYPERDANYTSDAVLNTAMIKGMGIARLDGKSGASFTYSTSKMTIFAPHSAKKFSGSVDDNGNVTLTWRPSTDTDVTSYKLKKDVEGAVTYTDVDSKSNGYTDTVDLASNDQVKYSIVTTGTDGITAETEKFIVNEREERSEVLYDFEVGAQSQNGDFDNPHNAAMFNWYTGTVGDYGQYLDWYGISAVYSDQRRIMRGWINDNNYDWSGSTDSTVKGNIVADREYGYAGYQFNRVSNGGPGPVVDLSNDKDGYAVFNVSFEKDGSVQDLTDVYLTVNYGMQWSDVYGYKNGMTYGDAALEKLNHAAVAGVKASDYYDVNKGGYQTIMIPLSAFTNAGGVAMKDIITPADIPTDVHYDKYLAAAQVSDFAEHMELFSGLAIARKNQSAGKMFEVKVKDMYILSTPAPAFVTAQKVTGGVNVTWKKAGLDGVTSYEVYRDGRKIATVNNALSYTDTDALAAGEYTYGVKTVSPKYEGHTSPMVTAAVEIPKTEEIKFFKGTGADRTETKYVEAGTIDVDIMAEAQGSRGYAAVFGADGTLKAVKTAALGSETARTLTFANVLLSDTVKAFIFKADSTPLCKPEKIASRGTRVLVIGDESSVQSTEYLDDIAAADGGKMTVVNLYKNGAVMSDHYANIKNDGRVYTLAVNGTVTGENVSFDSLDSDYDYVIIQDKTVYAAMDGYYAEGGSSDTQLPEIINAIKAKAPNAKIIANGSAGFTAAYYANADEALKTYLEKQGYTDFSYVFSCTMLVTGAFEEVADTTVDNNMTVSNYDGTGAKAFAQDGYSLSANGKFLVGANLYKAMTNKEIKASFAPSDVTDADAVADAVNIQAE